MFQKPCSSVTKDVKLNNLQPLGVADGKEAFHQSLIFCIKKYKFVVFQCLPQNKCQQKVLKLESSLI